MIILFKILLFPFWLLLNIFILVGHFIIITCAGALNVISWVAGSISSLGLLAYFFMPDSRHWSILVSICILSVISFLCSPFGLPLFGVWLLEKLARLARRMAPFSRCTSTSDEAPHVFICTAETPSSTELQEAANLLNELINTDDDEYRDKLIALAKLRQEVDEMKAAKSQQ